MVDVMKIGGITGWLKAAALAEAAGLPVSSHLWPEVSAQLLAVTPTAHYLEYLDTARPILQQPALLEDGRIVIRDEPGSGSAVAGLFRWFRSASDTRTAVVASE